MSVRAAGFVVVLGAVLLGILWGAGTVGAAPLTASAPSADTLKDFPLASEVRLGGDETQTRMVVDLSQKVDIRAFTLATVSYTHLTLPTIYSV